jgi:hypothetical protein
MLVGRTR